MFKTTVILLALIVIGFQGAGEIKQREDQVSRKEHATDLDKQELNDEIAKLKTFIEESQQKKLQRVILKTPYPQLTSGKPL